MNIKRWNIAPLDKDRAAQMAEEYQIPFFLAMLLEIRGLRTREQIQEMLQGQARRCGAGDVGRGRPRGSEASPGGAWRWQAG